MSPQLKEGFFQIMWWTELALISI